MAGWCELFEEVGRFLGHLEQQLGYASEAYTEYAIERLSMCVTNVQRIQEVLCRYLEDNTGNKDADIDAVVETYDQMCDELLQSEKTTRVTFVILLMRLCIVLLWSIAVKEDGQSL